MPVLGYWKMRGLAQPIRLLLHYVGEQFEDVYYVEGDGPEFSKAPWRDIQHNFGLDFPDLPYFIDGDIRLTQSNAILRYIGRKHDLLGRTEEERVKVDMMLDTAMDIRNHVVYMAYHPEYARLIQEYEPRCKEILTQLEKWLTKNKWFAGENVTVADFPLYEMLDQHTLMLPGCLDPHTRLRDFRSTFQQLPRVQAYMQSDAFIRRPVNNKAATFK